MFSTHAARHCHSFTLLRRSLTSLRTPTIRHATLKTLARPQTTVQPCLPATRRYASSTNAVTNAAKAQLNRVIGSLDLLNVYQGSTVRTVFVGMTRITTIVVFGLAVFSVAPRMYLDPETSMWMVPAVVVGGAIPLVVMVFLSAPFVSTIRVLLPASAKKNVEALHRFAENVPPDTRIMLQSMRWVPWPTHREMFFGDLRRLPGGKLSVNLEHLPLGHDKARNADKLFGGRLAMRMYGRYWVDMTTRNKSQAPGVWEKMWDQITIKGQTPLKIAPADKKPPAMANRPPQGAATAAARKAPPPPPKPKGAKSRR